MRSRAGSGWFCFLACGSFGPGTISVHPELEGLGLRVLGTKHYLRSKRPLGF